MLPENRIPSHPGVILLEEFRSWLDARLVDFWLGAASEEELFDRLRERAVKLHDAQDFELKMPDRARVVNRVRRVYGPIREYFAAGPAPATGASGAGRRNGSDARDDRREERLVGRARREVEVLWRARHLASAAALRFVAWAEGVEQP